MMFLTVSVQCKWCPCFITLTETYFYNNKKPEFGAKQSSGDGLNNNQIYLIFLNELILKVFSSLNQIFLNFFFYWNWCKRETKDMNYNNVYGLYLWLHLFDYYGLVSASTRSIKKKVPHHVILFSHVSCNNMGDNIQEKYAKCAISKQDFKSSIEVIKSKKNLKKFI